jgi:SpoVK/Ycf46/Vps4 family AAA+-type ATPase
MYVGNSEKNIRELFIQAEKHWEQHEFPAIIFVDEADAIMGERGGSENSSSMVDRTIVPMFLSEMDGLQESRAIVILATNRPKSLDPAIIREGRIDRHIKINRPNQEGCKAIFKIHFADIPVVGMELDKMIDLACKDVFSENKKIYKITDRKTKEELFFNFSDCLTGAMIKGFVDQATTFALRRDLENKEQTGVKPQDLKKAIKTIYESSLQRSHNFDLEDFYEKHNLSQDSVQKVRVKVSKPEDKTSDEKSE